MKRYLIVGAAIAALTLVMAATASAHPGGWYWGTRTTENYIVAHFNTSDGVEVDSVDCYGMGRNWRGMYHHLRCFESDALGRVFTVIAHPTSRYRAAVIEIACDDSESEDVCPS